MIEAMPKNLPTQCAKLICDECGKEEVAACGYYQTGRGARRPFEPDAHQLRKKLNHQLGWTYVKKVDRCPKCESARKVVPIKPKETAKMEKLRQPTKEQKRQIMEMLREVYDTDAECYEGGETDNSVAETLGVMPGWVAELRDEFFGAAGDNADMAKLAEALREKNAAFDGIIKEATKALGDARKAQQTVIDMQKALDAIRAAVGKHVVKKARAS